MNLDMDSLRRWIGRTEQQQDAVTHVPPQALGATLDWPPADWANGTELPPCWHWLFFLPRAPQSELGPDGHARRGGFLPPVPLPRRMWAGSQLEFAAPLRVGQLIRRQSRIADVRLKEGRGGPMVFVHVEHEIHADGQVCVRERHDLVYRDLPQPGDAAPAGQPAPADAQWTRRVVPDDVLLFRYSALTFNGHRIHYDRRYATEVEGYPGLVVHGPLIATLLLDLLRRELPQARVARFAFRALRPLFDNAPFRVCGQSLDAGTVRLWAATEDGLLAMDATATLA